MTMSRHPYISYASGYYGILDSNPDNLAEWRNYMKDISVARYTADSIVSGIGKELENVSDRIGESIESASREQVFAINNLANEIGIRLDSTNEKLNFLNRKMDITIEQQKAGLLLQHNIAELLKIPDSEKERQQSITLGLKFFINAKKDPDLYKDALEEFLKAESLMKQDYFVLHRIGCIYLYCPDLMDINKALGYFIKAGKYAAVDSSADSAKLANLLTNSINSEYTDTLSSEEQIGRLAADSFDKGALSAYILGDYNQAVELQKKAVSLNKSGKYYFFLAKYLFKAGNSDEACKQLDTAIEKDPEMMKASFLDKDIIQAPQTKNVLLNKREEAENDIEEYLIKYMTTNSSIHREIISAMSTNDYVFKRDVLTKIHGDKKDKR